MKRIAIYLFLVVALMLINQKAEASSKNILGICLTGKSYSWNYNIEKDNHGKNYHKAFKGKSLSKIKKKLKCETFFIDKDASPELYSVITKKLILFDDFFYLRKTDFNKLNKEFGILDSTTEIAETKSTGLFNELEKVEQTYIDGLITKKECTKAKEKLYETAGRTVDDLSVSGCRKDQKLIAKKKKQKKTATKKKKLSIYEQVENGTKKIDDLSAAEWPEYIAERNRRQKNKLL